MIAPEESAVQPVGSRKSPTPLSPEPPPDQQSKEDHSSHPDAGITNTKLFKADCDATETATKLPTENGRSAGPMDDTLSGNNESSNSHVRKKKKHKRRKRTTSSSSPGPSDIDSPSKTIPREQSEENLEVKRKLSPKSEHLPRESRIVKRNLKRCRRGNASSDMFHGASDSLVAYASSADEMPSIPVKKSVAKKDCSDAVSKSAVNSTHSSPKSKAPKVVKTTSKSTWDSSDSDFDLSGLHHNPQLADNIEDADSVKTTQSSSSKHAHPHCPRTNSKKVDSRDSHDEEENRKESTRSPSVKRSKSKRRHKRHRARKYSVSSRDSCDSLVKENRDEKRADSAKGKRSRSRRRSGHLSDTSEYTPASSHSSGSHRRRRRRRRRSTTYSSSRDSSRASSRRYSSRSRSSSRSDRRRRRRSYRRRYRRRSYSSRSRSWRSSDASSSYRSSRSLSRRSSALSRHRSSTSNRSPSHSRSDLHRRIISSSKKVPAVRTTSDTMQNHFMRKTQDQNSRQPKYLSSTTFPISSVSETVSAAVKRVTSGHYGTKTSKPPEPSSLRLTTEPNSLSGSTPVENSVLVDIPLPKDGSEQGDQSNHSEPTPYIGPQLPPELAKRFGLMTSSSSEPNGNAASTPTTAGDSATNSKSEPSTMPATSNEYLIPPEKVEQYRALQEQAKQHALRRTNLLNTTDATHTASSLSLNNPGAFGAQAQHLSLLQQQLHLVGSPGFVYPAYSLGATLIQSQPTLSAEALAHQQLAQLSEEARLRTLSSIISAQQYQQQQQQQQIAAMAAGLHKPQAVDSMSSMLPTAVQQQLQQNQAQQIMSAVAALQAAQASSNATGATVVQPQSALTAQLLQQLTNQQFQHMAGNAINASTLAAYVQQQKLQAQLQRQSLEALQRGASGTDNRSALNLLNELNLSNASNVNQNVLSSAIARIRALNTATPTVGASIPQATLLSVAAQQQLLASALRSSNAQLSGTLSSLPQDANTSALLQGQLGALAPRFLSQQQQLLQALQQKQLLQQQQQQQQRLLASNPSDQSLFQAQLAAVLQQQQRQQQQQLVQCQLQQQQHQQQLAASALASAAVQRQQAPQDPSGNV